MLFGRMNDGDAGAISYWVIGQYKQYICINAYKLYRDIFINAPEKLSRSLLRAMPSVAAEKQRKTPDLRS